MGYAFVSSIGTKHLDDYACVSCAWMAGIRNVYVADKIEIGEDRDDHFFVVATITLLASESFGGVTRVRRRSATCVIA